MGSSRNRVASALLTIVMACGVALVGQSADARPTPTVGEDPPAPRPVKCCDGTLSPTCVCGGKLRGCCSHHRGVCGCAE